MCECDQLAPAVGLAVSAAATGLTGFLIVALIFYLDRFVEHGNVNLSKTQLKVVFSVFVALLSFGIFIALFGFVSASDGFSVGEMNLQIWLFAVWVVLVGVLASVAVHRSLFAKPDG